MGKLTNFRLRHFPFRYVTVTARGYFPNWHTSITHPSHRTGQRKFPLQRSFTQPIVPHSPTPSEQPKESPWPMDSQGDLEEIDTD